MNPEDAQRLRQQSGDAAVYQQMLSDPEFKAKVDRVQQGMPNMTDFEKLKLPTALLDLQFGKKRTITPTQDATATMVNSGMQKAKTNSPMDQGALSYIGQTIKNIPGSTANLIGGVANMAMHPIKTAETAFQLGVGGAANTIESIASLAGVKNPEDIFDLKSEEVANAVGDFYVQRYGSVEAAATTLRDDPAGFLSDLGALVSGVGGIVKGGATALGAATGAATKSATALSGLGRGLRAAESIGSSLIKTGVNMEPLVITGKGVIMAGRGVTNATVAGVKGMAPSVMATKGLKINPSDIRAFENLPGNELPGDFLLRKGILAGGDIAVGESGLKMTGASPLGRTRVGIMTDLEKIAEKAKFTVDNELSRVRQTYHILDDTPPDVPKLLGEMQTIANKYDLAEPKSFIAKMLEKENVTLADLNEVKRMAYDMFTTYKRSNLADDSFRARQINQYEGSLRAFIEMEAEKKGLPDIRLLNQDTQKARDILDAMHSADAASWSKGKLTFGLMDGMFGLGAFSITGDFFSTAGIVIGRKVLESTVFKTTFAKYLNKLDPMNIKMIEKAFKSSKHTKESRQALRQVVKQTANDIQNQRIAEAENVMPPPQPSRTTPEIPGAKVQSLPDNLQDQSPNVNPLESPKALPRDGATTAKEATNLMKKYIYDLENEIRIKQQLLDEMPDMRKLANKKTGELPEVTGVGKSSFSKNGDDIADQLGYEDSEALRTAHERANSIREEVKSLKSTLKEAKNELALTKKFPNLTPEEIARLTPEEKATWLIGGSDSVTKNIEVPAMKQYLEKNGIKVNPDDTVTVYHVTTAENAASIEKSGLIRGGSGAPNGMTGTKEPMKSAAFAGFDKKWTVDTWGSGRPSVIEMKVPVNEIRHGAQNFQEAFFENGVKRGNDGLWHPVKLQDTFVNKMAVLEYQPAPLPSVGGGLEPLMKEARKYKSAEQFVKAQGEPLYHGTNATFEVFDPKKMGSATDDGLYGKGFYFGNTENFARVAPRGARAKNVMEVYPKSRNFFDISNVKSVDEMAKVLDMSPDSFRQETSGIIRPLPVAVPSFTSKVKGLGYDGVVVKRGGDAIETVVFDPKNLQTKSQLTDIWKEANQSNK